ncbi:hypothetical protein CDAR_228881 [Caerostris darwini]|uniref:Uncharacterized protein n=1 Tax=Caerostris darwini TaxID=1538125 RepID=A0AAV4VMQ8_9ARAC|nr:hypothetical protein CDAR_228881 [Caerostris darwini]
MVLGNGKLTYCFIFRDDEVKGMLNGIPNLDPLSRIPRKPTETFNFSSNRKSQIHPSLAREARVKVSADNPS